jgi:hypothetical protein
MKSGKTKNFIFAVELAEIQIYLIVVINKRNKDGWFEH